MFRHSNIIPALYGHVNLRFLWRVAQVVILILGLSYPHWPRLFCSVLLWSAANCVSSSILICCMYGLIATLWMFKKNVATSDSEPGYDMLLAMLIQGLTMGTGWPTPDNVKAMVTKKVECQNLLKTKWSGLSETTSWYFCCDTKCDPFHSWGGCLPFHPSLGCIRASKWVFYIYTNVYIYI